MRLRHLLTKATTVAAVFCVSATSVTAIAAPPAVNSAGPALQNEQSVPGRPVEVKPLPNMAMPTAAPAPVSWPAAEKSEVDTRSGAEPKQAGRSPVAVTARRDTKVAVETFGQETSAKAGIAGVLLKVSPVGAPVGDAASVRVDYSKFAKAYGGDYGSRLVLRQFPACVLTTPEKSECHKSNPLVSKNDVKRKELTAEVPVADRDGMVIAAVAADSGSGGSYGATSLAPSGSWTGGGSSGDFGYSVPLNMPTAPGGPAPQLAFGYSSGSIDGRTSSTNNQASWVGDGWDLSAGGFIERSYTSCVTDKNGNQGTEEVGDLCWKGEQYTISLGGASGKLIKDGNGRLRPENDDGSRIEKLSGAVNDDNNGEHWKVTTPDGTQYFLGKNRLPGWTDGKPVTNSALNVPVFGNHAGEDCHQAAFKDSSCVQAYRWNVDLVIDPRGNAMSFYYDKEINHYKRGGFNGANTKYDATGRLARIEYGLREDALFAKPPARVVFETAERCLPSGAITCDPGQLNKDTAKHWPDVPFERLCAAGENCTGRYSPGFFTRKRLTRVVTQSLNQVSNNHDDVDSWTLRHEFPATTDGQDPSLWLSGVRRHGHVGGGAALSLPEMVFSGEAKDNRVDGFEGIVPFRRYRLTRIVSEAGALTEVKYMERDCDRATRMPDTAKPWLNTFRCYPVWWSPPGAPDPVLDWFHKYVVEAVTEDSRTAGPSQTKSKFEYVGDAAWHYDANDTEEANLRTWSEWRGYGRVKSIKGDVGTPQTITETLYLRGMDEDTLPDNGKRDIWVTDGDGGRIEDKDQLAGFARETLLHSGGKVVSAAVSEPQVVETANDGKDKAARVQVTSKTERTLQGSVWRRTRVNSTYNSMGLTEKVDNEGDLAVSGDESCAQTTYVNNDTKWMFGYASASRTIAKPCSAWPGTADDVLNDVQSSYDGQPHGTAPTRGVVTHGARWVGAGPHQGISTIKTDDYGRTIEAFDADGGKTTTRYTPAVGTPHTVTTTNRVGWETTSILDTARGVTLTELGVNGERSDMEYDKLGRLIKVWQPGREKLKNALPNAEYSYEYRTNAPTVVTSKSLKDFDGYAVSYDLYDGMLRPRQSQTPAVGGGRMVTENFYDSRGNAFKTNAAFYNTGLPAPELLAVQDVDVPNQTVIEFDDLSRPLETILKNKNVELWRTKTRYNGDITYTTPPAGGTATAVIKNAQGAVVERREYTSHSPDGYYWNHVGFTSTKYTLNAKTQLAAVTDAKGNKWEYKYDSLGRKSSDTDPDRGGTTYTYDEMDQVKTTTDARGKTLAFAYDDLGRNTAVHEGSLSGTKLTEFTYDTLRKGLPTSATRYVDGNAYIQRVDQYDDVNRPKTTSVVIPASEGKLAGTYKYWAQYTSHKGLLAVESLPAVGGLSAESIIHEYNDLGLPEESYGSSTYATEHKYSPYGETLRLTLGQSPKKVWLANTYTEGTRRLEKAEAFMDDGQGRPVSQSDLTYTYDPAGNITKIKQANRFAAESQCFTYDHLRRLTSAWTPKSNDCTTAKSVPNLGGVAPYWNDFTFDEIGNRKTQVQHTPQGDVSETYENPASGPTAVRPHAVTTVKGPNGTAKSEYEYDAAGNTIVRKVGGNAQKIDWNSEGRVSRVTEADGNYSDYIYDAGGNRLLKKEPNSTTLYLPKQEVFLAKNATTPTAKRYYTHGGTTVAVRSPVEGLSWLPGNHQGTTEITFTDMLWVSQRFTDPYGNPRGEAPFWWPDDKGFVGGTKDSTGLTSIGAREYDPAIGRFLSVDPVMDSGDSQQIHGYSYANNSPVTFSDPTGLYLDGGDDGMGGTYGHDASRNILVGYWPIINDEKAYLNKKQWRQKQRWANQRKQNADVQNGANARARRELGMSDEEVHRMEEEAHSTKGFWGVMMEELPDLLGDITGYNDLRDCFTKFDLWACASIIPWGKLVKLIGSSKKVYKAVRKALTWEERVSEARSTLSKVNGLTEKFVREGMEDLNKIRKAEADAEKAAETAASSCKLHSFPPGTLVLLADGTSKPIEQVKIDDVVLAANPETGSTEARPVVATWVHDNEPTRTELTLDTDGTAGSATATISATDWHPIWVADLKAWVPIANIKAGSWLQTASGTWTQVTATRSTTDTGKAYDLTIDTTHTYHVLAGATPILVHNCGDGSPEFGSACTCSEDQVFVRRGTSWEGTGRLEKQAEAAESNPKPFGHGVSVTTSESNALLSRNPADSVTATKAQIEGAGFRLRYTPTNSDKMHHTLELPKPFDSAAAKIFNTLFGRKR